MDEPTKIPSSSFKATLAKFKKFARDCAEEALRTANNVRRSSASSGNAHREVKLTENKKLGQTSIRSQPEETNENNVLSIISEENDNDGASVVSLMANKSIQIMENMQATISIEDLTAEAAEEIVTSGADRDTSEDVSSAVQEEADVDTTTMRKQIELVTAKIDQVDLMARPSTEQADLIAKSSLESGKEVEQVGNVACKLGDRVKSAADIVNESIVGGSDNENEEANERLMAMIEKSDVTCTLVGDPSEDYAEACKIVCEFDEESKVNAKRCEYACLAVNNLRDEVLNTAKEISNKGEREKNTQSDTLNLMSD